MRRPFRSTITSPKALRSSSVRIIPLGLLILSGCATPIPPPPDVIRIPVPTPCITAMPLKPVIHTDPQLAVLDDFKFSLAIFQDRRLLLDYTAELEATLSACK